MIYKPYSMLWTYPGVSYQFEKPGGPPLVGAQMLQPPQLALFARKEQQLHSKFPPDVQPPHSISKAQPSHPMDDLIL